MIANLEEAEALVSSYEELVERAVAILAPSGPPWGFIGEPSWARLSFEGDDVVIRHPEADSYYDSLSIETKEARFPSALLFMSADDLAAWRKTAREEYDRQQREIAGQRAAAQELAERQAYEALRRKFG